jgi:hypothetical protein
MRNGICSRCQSNEVLAPVRLQHHNSLPYVEIIEPEPAKRPFIWQPQTVKSNFVAFICGACGYSEFYADNFQNLNEGRKKGFKTS